MMQYNACMIFISTLYKTILDALFPLSWAEYEMLSLSPEDALGKLPPAPDYSGLAVDMPNAQSVFAYKDERVAKMIWHIKYKKSAHAVQIGGYALWKRLVTTAAGVRRAVLRDTPSTSAEVAAGSPSPSLSPKRPENSLPPPAAVVIPMPITNRRRKERGYNQCELLTDEMERLEQTNDYSRFTVRKDILFRTHHATRQTLKGRHERVESAKGIFGVRRNVITPELLRAKIIVIDDVITTGSTMYEAIETLGAAGFSDVGAISLAH